MRNRTDRELVELARRGNRQALGELFSRYWQAARAAAFGITGNVPSAEDAAAEAFRLALGGIDSLRDPDRFGPWLRAIVVRHARRGRDKGRVTAEPLEDLPDPGCLPDETLEDLEVRALLQRAISELPERLREAVSLCYLEGYETSRAAQFLDIPDGTLRRRLHEARGQLRKAMEVLSQRGSRVHRKRAPEIDQLRQLIDDPDGADHESVYQVLRESLALRPVPMEIGKLFRRMTTSGKTFGFEPAELVGKARALMRPSDRALDPTDPVGCAVVRIRQVLTEFAEWTPNLAMLLADFADSTRHEYPQALLPPGFAEGRPGAFLRVTRALLSGDPNGGEQTVYQLFRDSGNSEIFSSALERCRLADVVDLTWMATPRVDLWSVQALLERLSAHILREVPVRFSAYDEPRYRAALQMELGSVRTVAARGGVLAAWAGRPPGVDAAHVRIFLEAWAAPPGVAP